MQGTQLSAQCTTAVIASLNITYPHLPVSNWWPSHADSTSWTLLSSHSCLCMPILTASLPPLWLQLSSPLPCTTSQVFNSSPGLQCPFWSAFQADSPVNFLNCKAVRLILLHELPESLQWHPMAFRVKFQLLGRTHRLLVISTPNLYLTSRSPLNSMFYT